MPVKSFETDNDAPKAIRENLERLGVDLDFWKNHHDRVEEDEALVAKVLAGWNWTGTAEDGRIEVKLRLGLRDDPDDSEEERSERADLRRKIANFIEDTIRDQASDNDDEILNFVHALTEMVDPPLREWRGFPGQLVLIGDALRNSNRLDVAKEVYARAIDEAKTPQAQMEIGYLLAFRGRVKHPGYWVPAEIGESPILLLPDRWMGHSGLPYFEVIYEELLPGPDFPNSIEMLRLALEAYGRVFGYCYPADEEGRTATRDEEFPPQAVELGPFAIDGLHSLLAAVESPDLNLVHACMSSLWEYSSGRACGSVEDRLRASETYLKGKEHGRDERDTSESADLELRRTVVTDPQALAELTADAVMDRLGKVPPPERNEVEDFFRDRFHPHWDASAPGNFLVDAELEYLKVESDHLAVISRFATAAELYLKSISPGRKTLGEFCKTENLSKVQESLPKAPMEALRYAMEELNALWVTYVKHPEPTKYTPAKRGQADSARTYSVLIAEILLKFQPDGD